jgi:hypothetical protein
MIRRRESLRYYYTYTREKRNHRERQRSSAVGSDSDTDTLEGGIPKEKLGISFHVEHGTRTGRKDNVGGL